MTHVNDSFAEIASKFQWECKYIPPSNAEVSLGTTHLIMCWGRFQDGLDYQYAEYIKWEECSEVALEELGISTYQAMRRRFDRIEDDRTEGS